MNKKIILFIFLFISTLSFANEESIESLKTKVNDSMNFCGTNSCPFDKLNTNLAPVVNVVMGKVNSITIDNIEDTSIKKIHKEQAIDLVEYKSILEGCIKNIDSFISKKQNEINRKKSYENSIKEDLEKAKKLKKDITSYFDQTYVKIVQFSNSKEISKILSACNNIDQFELIPEQEKKKYRKKIC
jgi:hypothetical protein